MKCSLSQYCFAAVFVVVASMNSNDAKAKVHLAGDRVVPPLISEIEGTTPRLSEPATAIETPFGPLRLRLPEFDPMKGKKLFVDKGCVACHAVNGVGGHDAPSFDAHKMLGLMNPFEFAAKMWKGAEAMIAAQQGTLERQLLFSGAELAHIIAFAHSDTVQHTFTEADLTAAARKMMDHSHEDKDDSASHPAARGGHSQDHEDGPNDPPHMH